MILVKKSCLHKACSDDYWKLLSYLSWWSSRCIGKYFCLHYYPNIEYFRVACSDRMSEIAIIYWVLIRIQKFPHPLPSYLYYDTLFSTGQLKILGYNFFLIFLYIAEIAHFRGYNTCKVDLIIWLTHSSRLVAWGSRERHRQSNQQSHPLQSNRTGDELQRERERRERRERKKERGERGRDRQNNNQKFAPGSQPAITLVYLRHRM